MASRERWLRGRADSVPEGEEPTSKDRTNGGQETEHC